jgi:hypothetical protein
MVISRWPDPDETVWVAGVEALLPYLTWTVELDTDFTLGDLFHLIDRDDVTLLEQILHEELAPVLEEAREGPSPRDDDEALHFLRVYNQHEDGDVHRGLDAWGSWNQPYEDGQGPAGARDTWVSVSLTPVGRLLHLPIRYDPELLFQDRAGQPEYRTRVGITLIEFLKAIFDDLTFHGSPEDRDGVRLELLRRVEEIERGEAELIPAEEVFRDLQRKLDIDGEA